MKSTKKLINEPKNAVTEYLEGYVSSVEHMQLLEGAPDISVVTQIPPINDSKVAIISVSQEGVGVMSRDRLGM